MFIINRSVAIIKPKQPFVDWANSVVDEEQYSISDFSTDCSVILLPIFTLPSDNFEEFKDIKSLKGCSGRMVRSDSHGIAIQFDKECQIEGLKVL